jgi:hypothetical protein
LLLLLVVLVLVLLLGYILLLLLLLLLSSLARMLRLLRCGLGLWRRPAGIETARDGGVGPCRVTPLLLLLLLLLRGPRAWGVGVPRVGWLSATGLCCGRVLRFASPDAVLVWAGAVPSAAERVMMLVMRMWGHACRRTL